MNKMSSRESDDALLKKLPPMRVNRPADRVLEVSALLIVHASRKPGLKIAASSTANNSLMVFFCTDNSIVRYYCLLLVTEIALKKLEETMLLLQERLCILVGVRIIKLLFTSRTTAVGVRILAAMAVGVISSQAA